MEMMNVYIPNPNIAIFRRKIEVAGLTNCTVMTYTDLAILRISFILIDKN